jgi:chromosome partitioning protein
MKIIAVANQKGGCGKTITAVNLAAALSKKGNRVLLIDLDPQAHATYSLRKERDYTITDILESATNNSLLAPDKICLPVSDNFYFIPSSIGLAALEQKLTNREDRFQILNTFLDAAANYFDYCLLDCPPNLGILTLNALSASHYCLIPINMCDFSLRGIEILKNIMLMLKDFSGKTPTPFYLLTQVDKRSAYSRTFIYKVKDQLGGLLLKAAIRSNIHLREAAATGKHIFEFMPDSRGALDFLALAENIQQITSRGQWTSLFLKGSNFTDVYAVGDFNNWQKSEQFKLNKIGDVWSINLPLEKGQYRYKFVAGNNWFADPHNTCAEDDSFGGKNSLLHIE